MRGTGRPTQLPGRLMEQSTTWGAFRGFEHHFGGVMAVSGGGRTTTPPKWCWTPISASKGVILTRIRPGNWVGRPAPRTSTFFILTTRLQLRSRRRHERAPPRKAMAPPKWCLKPINASKVVLSLRTRPGNWVGRPVSYNIKLFLLSKRLQLRSQRRHERAPPHKATYAT